jgi:DNA-binding response OmpR family regulator
VASFDDGSLHIDFDLKGVTLEGRVVDLRPKDFGVLTVLVRHQGVTLSLERLVELAAWEDQSWLSRDRMKYSLARLKHDLGWGADGPIETVRGVGWRFRSTSG